MIIQDLTQDPIMEPPEEFPVVESESLPSSAKQKIDLVEAKGVLASMSLISVTFGHYLLVMRSQYDVMLSGEPYVALMLWLNVETGKFVTRIWNQTAARGEAMTIEQFAEACHTHFSQGKPCL